MFMFLGHLFINFGLSPSPLILETFKVWDERVEIIGQNLKIKIDKSRIGRIDFSNVKYLIDFLKGTLIGSSKPWVWPFKSFNYSKCV